jgi:hypothetical protein
MTAAHCHKKSFRIAEALRNFAFQTKQVCDRLELQAHADGPGQLTGLFALEIIKIS